MAIAFVTSVAAKSTDSNGFTTGTCDTTGANLLSALQNYFTTVGAISDSKGNSWSNLSAYGAGRNSRISYSTPSVVGTGHTFTVGGTANYPSLAVLAFSGAAAASPFDVENGANGAGGFPVQSGSVTPSQDGEVLVASTCWNNGTAISSINGGFTLQHNQPAVSSQCVAGATAYLIQTTAAAANPTWVQGSNDFWSANIATFKVAAAAGSAIKTIMGLALASVKTINGLAIASVKTVGGLA